MRSLAFAAALAGTALARRCRDLNIPIQISAQNTIFNIPVPVTNIDVVNFALTIVQPGANLSSAVSGQKTISSSYNIAATYCEPNHGSQPETVQILTHGIGFDRSYWDFPYDNYNYSYVVDAVDKYGFATFSWDRLGIGHSSHGEPLNEIQISLEIEALHTLTQMVQQGEIDGCEKPFEKVVHVGHSFGSAMSYGLTALYPNISDALVLTGFSLDGTYQPYFLFGGNYIQANKVPRLFDYPNGYIVNGDISGLQTQFFAPGQFDPEVLSATFATGQPAAVGEFLTVGSVGPSGSQLAKPVLIITGNRDLPFCGGNCNVHGTGDSSIPGLARAAFPKATTFEVVIVPDAGHGLNLEFSHPFTYSAINEFLIKNGDGPQ